MPCSRRGERLSLVPIQTQKIEIDVSKRQLYAAQAGLDEKLEQQRRADFVRQEQEQTQRTVAELQARDWEVRVFCDRDADAVLHVGACQARRDARWATLDLFPSIMCANSYPCALGALQTVALSPAMEGLLGPQIGKALLEGWGLGRRVMASEVRGEPDSKRVCSLRGPQGPSLGSPQLIRFQSGTQRTLGICFHALPTFCTGRGGGG